MLHGERLDKPTYRFLQTITEEGNNAVCYRGEHEIFGGLWVQKTISMVQLPDAVACHEPRLLNDMTHPNIVEIREAQWDPDEQWKKVDAITFVMPYYPGGSVSKALSEGHRFSVGEAVGVARGLLSALHYVHAERNVLHRDVKPGNLFLDATRTHGYLGDLGSSAFMQDGAVEARGGTMLYRPPEYVTGALGVPADIYGAGMVLLEMLGGRLPFEDLDYEVIERRVQQGRRALPNHFFQPPPHVTGRLATLLRGMTAADPASRPQTAESALRVLEKKAKFIDWRLAHSDDTSETWLGRWPYAPTGRGREYRTEFRMLAAGPNAGRFAATAAWRREGEDSWRHFNTLEQRVSYDVTERRRFFESVFAAADKQPAAS